MIGHQLRLIDLAALRRNVRRIKQALPEKTQLLAVVKADAYGHGMVQVARATLQAGASHLAVALAEEGAALREAGVEAPVLVLGAALEDEALLGVTHGLTMTVCTPAMVQTLERAARQTGKQAMAHLKIDTGMGRIGARTEQEVRAVVEELANCPHVSLTGAFTHFADADGDDMTFTCKQLERFRQLTEPLPRNILRHCANSAAIHRLPEAAMDMVRAGISMYGYPPVPTDMPLEQVMTWRTRVTYVKDIQPGDTVSYGCTFTADKPLRVVTLACGYGDGYHRAASDKAEVIIHGQRAKVLGHICMDQMMADVTDIPGVAPGDTVTLLGQDGEACITADELAAWAGTISYEVLLAATGRVARKWLHEDE